MKVQETLLTALRAETFRISTLLPTAEFFATTARAIAPALPLSRAGLREARLPSSHSRPETSPFPPNAASQSEPVAPDRNRSTHLAASSRRRRRGRTDRRPSFSRGIQVAPRLQRRNSAPSRPARPPADRQRDG